MVASTNWGRHLWILLACNSRGWSMPAGCGMGDTAPGVALLQAHAVHLGLQGLRWIRHWVNLQEKHGWT